MIADSSRFAFSRLYDKKVIFCGFQSSVGELYANGWELQSQPDVMMDGLTVYLVHRSLRLAGRVDRVSLHERIDVPLVIRQVLPADHTVIRTEMEMPKLFPLEPGLNMSIDYLSQRDYRLSDLLQISTPAELVVDPDEVQSLLDRIVELQRPKQKELRAKARKSAKRTEAQIISLIDYREAG